ncbi:hypothetical protein P0D88_34795 [Paraburkholderia sp. RL18-103-BIB-C]|uniref:hypothetical protein n=1 Tax=Paraburkholderia sp. RL18-103-BIB-C TaxID=3031637 RepID=UPI0038BB66F3
MTTEANTPQGTGITTDQAADQFASLLSDPIDKQEPGETQETTDEHEAHEGDEPEETEREPGESETDESEETEGEQAEQPQTFEIPIDGKKTTVTLDELTKGYLRHSDYTRKTTEVATQRNALAAEVSQTQAERTAYAQALEQANALLTELQPVEPDWNALYQADPAQYAATREMWRSYQEQRQAVEQQRQTVAQRAKADQARTAREFVEGQRGKLLEALPAWADPKVASAEKAQLTEWAAQNGFNADELNTIADHRAVVIMRKAMLFDRAAATRATLKPGQTPASKVKPATPGAQGTRPNSASEATRAKQRLARSGKVSDAATALEYLLD